MPANHGLRAHVETFNGEVTLEFRRKNRFVTYEVEGESTETGLRAQFGKLGLIDVTFAPTETRTERPPKGCEGPPSTHGEGIFTGTIQFSGEREFVKLEASRVKGTMDAPRENEWRCPGTGRAAPGQRERQGEDEGAALGVTSSRCRCLFIAYGVPEPRRPHSTFAGAKVEEREGMVITRVTYAEAAASRFAYDHEAGTATLRPPAPFSGHATFKRRPNRRDLWTSTIRVPLLGADPLAVSGRAYRARLVRGLPGD